MAGFILSEVSLWWTYFDISRSSYHFMVRVEGLSKYNGNGSTEVIVPVPVINGKYVYSDDGLANRKFGNWTTNVTTIEHEKMLVFKTSDNNLTDINAMFEQFNNNYIYLNKNDIITFSPSNIINAKENIETIKRIHWEYINYINNGQIDPRSENFFKKFIENESLNNSIYKTKIILADDVLSNETGDHTIIFNLIFTADSGLFPCRKSSTDYVLIYNESTEKTNGEIIVKALHGVDNPFIQFITGRRYDAY